VTLYELIALRQAFSGTDHPALVRQITDVGPPQLRSFNPSVPRDLETIVHKAIEKDPTHRYSSAAALADDLHRFLEDRPIAARRLGPAGIAWRWCRRNKAVAGLLLVVELLLTVGLVASVVVAGEFVKKADVETGLRQEAEKATSTALAAQGKADANAATERQARERIERLLDENKAVLDFLTELLAQTSPDAPQGSVLTIEDLLKNAEAKLEGRFGTQPLAEASIRHTLGHSYWMHGRFPEAEKHLKRALALRSEHLGDEHAETLRTRTTLGWTAHYLGEQRDLEMALKPFRDVLEIQRRNLGMEHADTIESSANVELVGANYHNINESSKLAEQTLVASRRVRGSKDPITLRLQSLVGEGYQKRGDIETARDMIEHAYGGMKETLGPHNWWTTWEHAHWADFLADVGELDRAATEFQQIWDEQRRISRPDHPMTVRWLILYITVLRERGDYRRADSIIEETLKTWLKDYSPEHPLVASAKATLAMDRGELEPMYKRLYPLVGLPDVPDSSDDLLGLAGAKRLLVKVLAWRGDVEEALKLAEVALKEWEPVYAGKDRWTAGDRDMIAQLLANAPVSRPGLRDITRALELARANVKAFPNDGQFLTTLGIAQYRAVSYDDSIVSLTKSGRFDGDLRVAPRGFYLAMAQWQKGDKDKARTTFDETAAWMDKNRPGHPELIPSRAEARTLLELNESGPEK
jgi:eukaryotic-like serine/threonine-protein kinase